MNHDAPMTLAAMQAHIAELEQQLKLSDEGVSQLAQRCLEPVSYTHLDVYKRQRHGRTSCISS